MKFIHRGKEGGIPLPGLNWYIVEGGYGGIVLRLVIGNHAWRMRIRDPRLYPPSLFLFGHWKRPPGRICLGGEWQDI